MIFSGRAFVYHGKGDVRLEDREVLCGPTDLVVKVLMCARCGTDKTIFLKGHRNVDPYAPVVLGHELVGEVVAVGDKVPGLTKGIGCSEGKRLSDGYLNFHVGERLTFQSRIARYRKGLMLIPDPIANLSFQIDGGYAQYMQVPAELIQSESVLRVPDNVSDEAACLVEPAACALESIFATPHPTGANSEGRHQYRAGILPGGLTCIIGSGTLSLIYAALAHLEGAREIHLMVRSQEKAALARKILGPWIRPYVAPQAHEETAAGRLAAEKKIVEEMKDITGGYLFDDVIAACADPNAQRLMLQLYTPEGYAVGACFGGTHEKVDGADIDLHHYRCAKTVGTSGCSTDAMKTVLRWLETGKLALDGFVDERRWSLQDSPAEFLTASSSLKPVLYPWDGHDSTSGHTDRH